MDTYPEFFWLLIGKLNLWVINYVLYIFYGKLARTYVEEQMGWSPESGMSIEESERLEKES